MFTRIGLAVAISIASAALAGAQSVKRTAWGDPDLQGLWPSGAMIEVPFERPVEFGTRAELTEAEYKKFAAEIAEAAAEDASESVATAGNSPAVTPPSHWLERGRPSRQTSLIVDPPDGRLPAATDDGIRRDRLWKLRASANYRPDGFEEMRPYDRCISRGVLGSTFPNIYGTGMQIIQQPGLVVIRYEMIHETRIIPLDGRPHIGGRIRSYMGDARGRWEGTTLVVETTNFNGRTGSYARNGDGYPTSESLTLVERFTPIAANTLRYRVTVNDPQTWTHPWTAAFPLTRDSTYQMFEYACHEGNYALRNMLSAARASEK